LLLISSSFNLLRFDKVDLSSDALALPAPGVRADNAGVLRAP
jgi:hypothetical protein